MKKNLFEKEAATEMIARAQSLQANHQPAWGTMNATEMLLHCNLCNLQILTGDLEYQKTTFKQRMLKFLSLYIVPQFPKNLKGAERNDTKGKIGTDHFETERRKFVEMIDRFANHRESVELTHPAFGNLNTRQWGIAAWMHTDHHLRQFGV